jgi:hypothetical protein
MEVEEIDRWMESAFSAGSQGTTLVIRERRQGRGGKRGKTNIEPLGVFEDTATILVI